MLARWQGRGDAQCGRLGEEDSRGGHLRTITTSDCLRDPSLKRPQPTTHPRSVQVRPKEHGRAEGRSEAGSAGRHRGTEEATPRAGPESARLWQREPKGWPGREGQEPWPREEAKGWHGPGTQGPTDKSPESSVEGRGPQAPHMCAHSPEQPPTGPHQHSTPGNTKPGHMQQRARAGVRGPVYQRPSLGREFGVASIARAPLGLT